MAGPGPGPDGGCNRGEKHQEVGDQKPHVGSRDSGGYPDDDHGKDGEEGGEGVEDDTGVGEAALAVVFAGDDLDTLEEAGQEEQEEGKELKGEHWGSISYRRSSVS